MKVTQIGHIWQINPWCSPFEEDVFMNGMIYTPHVVGWETCNLDNLGRGSWVGSVLYGSCTASHNGRLGYRWSRWSIWSIWSVWSNCPTFENFLSNRWHRLGLIVLILDPTGRIKRIACRTYKGTKSGTIAHKPDRLRTGRYENQTLFYYRIVRYE